MRKLIVWNLMTLDGYFEGEKPWDLGFHEYAWGPELQRLSEEQLREGDLLIFGRKTYEGMAAYWPTAEEDGAIKDFMNRIAKLVASRQMQSADWTNSRVTADPVAEVARLKAQDGKTMFVFGSAELTAALLKAGLVDEMRICIVPVLLGAGNPLFKRSEAQQRLELVGSETAKNGAVILRYRVPAAA